MTPQEQQLVNELFSRLVQLESAPRDPEAERLIADGVKKAPNATYALVQTTLVQDEALKRANALIQELQAQLDDAGQPQRQQGGFLDSMRDALFGGRAPQSGSPGTGAEPQPGFSPPKTTSGIAAQPNFPAGPTLGSGGSFLGTAAAAAAGVIGGGLLRSMFGQRADFARSDQFASGGHSQQDQNDIDDSADTFETGDTEDDGNFADDNSYADDDSYDV